MSVLQDDSQKVSHTELMDSLNDRQRRRVLRLLADESQAVPVRELAERLLTVDESTSVEDVAEATIEGVHVRLRHVHLPRLEDARLVDWDRDGGFVEAHDHPEYDDSEVRRLVEMDDEEWDALVDEMTHGRVRKVLTVLEADGESVRRDVLAHKVAAREANGDSWGGAVDSVRTALHHVHLPKLEGAGVVDYDADDGTVTYRGPTSGEEWQQ